LVIILQSDSILALLPSAAIQLQDVLMPTDSTLTDTALPSETLAAIDLAPTVST